MTHETTLRGPRAEDFIPAEGCLRCKLAIEEDCVRLGMFDRWHSTCVACSTCGEQAAPTKVPNGDALSPLSPQDEGPAFPFVTSRKPLPRVNDFFFEPFSPPAISPDVILCINHRSSDSNQGFATVSRLEQYVFLLHIAMRRLYVHFRVHHNLSSGESPRICTSRI